MRIRLHNDDDTDYIDYTGDTLEDIQIQAKDRLTYDGWKKGWSEEI